MKVQKYIVVFGIVFSSCSWAALTNESALGLVLVQGTAESMTTTLKQMNKYEAEIHLFTAKGAYTKTESNEATTAKSWDALARYDRELNERFAIYFSYDWESNRFAGFALRQTAELGSSYKLYDFDLLKWHIDLAYSHRQTDFVDQSDQVHSPGAVLATRFERQVGEGLSYDLWAKYRHDFSSEENHTMSLEPSLAMLITDIFSLKLSYVVKSQAKVHAPATEHTDTTFTTSLVAKF